MLQNHIKCADYLDFMKMDHMNRDIFRCVFYVWLCLYKPEIKETKEIKIFRMGERSWIDHVVSRGGWPNDHVWPQVGRRVVKISENLTAWYMDDSI